jgi:hypothetical protein
MTPLYRDEIAALIYAYATRYKVVDYLAEKHGMERSAVPRLMIRNGIQFPKYLATNLE